MAANLERILYCSHNAIPGDRQMQAHEIESILAVARSKNQQLEITGALYSSKRHFAQMLEGPQAAVEGVLESIQRDPRHRNVLVLETRPVETRLFPDWSMAFVEASHHEQEEVSSMLKDAFDRPQQTAEAVVELLHTLVSREF